MKALQIVLVLLAWAAAPQVLSAAVSIVDAHAIYPEGPVWLAGKLYYVEYGGPGIKVWNGTTSLFWQSAHCGPSGLIPYGDGHLLVACYDANAVVEIDASGHTLRSIDSANGKPFVGPNDFAADRHGGIYISASGVYDIHAPITGTILYLPPQGGLIEVADTVHYPNGLTVSADGRSLLVAEDLAGRILVFPINAGGTLGPRSVWARLNDLAPPTANADAYTGPDGLKLGPDGHYYIAQNGSGRVLVVDADKRLVRMLVVPTPYVTNMAFGDDNTVFITGVFDPWKSPYPGSVYRWTP